MGSPSKFRPEFIEQARKLAEMGHTDAEMAEFFGIALRNFHRWKALHPELAQVLKVGKSEADARVTRSLFQRAVGYTVPETVIHFEKRKLKHGIKVVPHHVEVLKHYPPDTTAGIFWLKNREPELWREKFEHDHGLTASREKLEELRRVVEERIGALEGAPDGANRLPRRTQ